MLALEIKVAVNFVKLTLRAFAGERQCPSSCAGHTALLPSPPAFDYAIVFGYLCCSPLSLACLRLVLGIAMASSS